MTSRPAPDDQLCWRASAEAYRGRMERRLPAILEDAGPWGSTGLENQDGMYPHGSSTLPSSANRK